VFEVIKVLKVYLSVIIYLQTFYILIIYRLKMAERSFHTENEHNDNQAFVHALTRATGQARDTARIRMHTSEEQMGDSVDTAHLLHSQKMRANTQEEFIRSRRMRQAEGSQ